MTDILKRLLMACTVIVLAGCQHKVIITPVTIGLTKSSGEKDFGTYGRWLSKADSTVVMIDFYGMGLDSACLALEKCDGLLLTGGDDVYPGWYGKTQDTSRCEDIDLYRDSLEVLLFKKALDSGIPIMGICRGEQISNVIMGGSLYINLTEDYDTMIIHRCEDTKSCFHNINIMPGSILREISIDPWQSVLSSHHQAIEQLAESFKVSARSDDHLIEAIEWKDPAGKPFFLAVQFHPEKVDTSSFSRAIALRFIHEILKNKTFK